MKPSMFGREIRKRLLNDGVYDGGNFIPALSTVNKGIKNKLRMPYKLILNKTEVTSALFLISINIELFISDLKLFFLESYISTKFP